MFSVVDALENNRLICIDPLTKVLSRVLLEQVDIWKKKLLVTLKYLILVGVKAIDFTKNLFVKIMFGFMRRVGAMPIFIPGVP
jgi:hypothetical protein